MKKDSLHQKCIKKLHDLTPENTWVRPADGKRYCRICLSTYRKTRYLTLDEETRLAFPKECAAGAHLETAENFRKVGTNKRKLKKVCIDCLEDEDYQYDNSFGAPLFDDDRKRIKWGDLVFVDFT